MGRRKVSEGGKQTEQFQTSFKPVEQILLFDVIVRHFLLSTLQNLHFLETGLFGITEYI